MKPNDIIVDKNQGIGIITKVDTDKIYVTFDYSNKVVYNTSSHKLSVIDNEFIEYIYQTFKESVESKKKNIMALYQNIISDFAYNDGCFSATILDGHRVKAIIDIKSKPICKCTCNLGRYCNHTEILLLYFREKVNALRNTSYESTKLNSDIINLTQEFIDTFFDFNIFKELCKKIKEKSFEEIYLYCIYLATLNVDLSYIRYLLLVVANNSNYLHNLCVEFSKSNNYLVSDTLTWALIRSNYSKENNYVLNTSIILFKENKMIDWIKLMIDKGNLRKIIDKNQLSYKLFIEVIKMTEDVNVLLEVLKDANLYKYDIDQFVYTIFLNTTEENQKSLVFEKKCLEISPEMFSYLSVKDIAINHRLMNRFTKRAFIRTYINEITKLEPKLIIDMMLAPDEIKYENDISIVKKVIAKMPDNKYLKKFCENIISNPDLKSIDFIVSKYK